MKTILFAMIAVFSVSSFAAEYRIQKVKTLGPMKHKVIFQSADLKKIKKTNVLKGKLVVQWGLHVYEVVNGLYACNKNLLCKLTDYERVATFEKCVVKNKTKVECRKRLDGGSASSSTEIVINESPDTVYDEYNRGPRTNYDETSEFPVRVNGEYDDVNF